MTVKLEQAIIPPATIVALSKTMSGVSPVKPAVPCKTVAPLESFARKWPAVPDASAVVSDVILLAVAVPDDDDPKAGSLKVNVPSSVPESASATLVGGDPVRTEIVPAPAPPSSKSTMASQAALRAAVEILKAVAILVFRYAVCDLMFCVAADFELLANAFPYAP